MRGSFFSSSYLKLNVSFFMMVFFNGWLYVVYFITVKLSMIVAVYIRYSLNRQNHSLVTLKQHITNFESQLINQFKTSEIFCFITINKSATTIFAVALLFIPVYIPGVTYLTVKPFFYEFCVIGHYNKYH